MRTKILGSSKNCACMDSNHHTKNKSAISDTSPRSLWTGISGVEVEIVSRDEDVASVVSRCFSTINAIIWCSVFMRRRYGAILRGWRFDTYHDTTLNAGSRKVSSVNSFLRRLGPYSSEYSLVSSNCAIGKIMITITLTVILSNISNNVVVVVVWLSLMHCCGLGRNDSSSDNNISSATTWLRGTLL